MCGKLSMGKSKRIFRYHKDLLFPSFLEESFKVFYEKVYETGPLTFSAHSVYKLFEYVKEYGTFFLKKVDIILKAGPLERENLFEFYADKSGNIIKACFRYSIENLPIDIVFVVAENATIITVYTTDKGDSHEFLNKNLYVRKEKNG